MNTVKEYKGHKVPEGAEFYREECKKHHPFFVRTLDGKQQINVSRAGLNQVWVTDSHKHTGLIKLPQTQEAYMPKVGEDCEMLIAEWEPVMPLFVGEQIVVIEIATAEISYSISKMEFRPIKTEREKVIEFATETNRALKYNASEKEMFEALYDAGVLKMPESKK